MRQLMLAYWKAPIVERISPEKSRRRCMDGISCGRKATIKLRLPHMRLDGRRHQFWWACEHHYKRSYDRSKAEYPDASDIPLTKAQIGEMYSKRVECHEHDSYGSHPVSEVHHEEVAES